MKRPFIIPLALWGILGIATALSAQTDISAAQRDTSEVRPARVFVGSTAVFAYTQPLGPFSPQERAQRLQALLDRLARDPALDVARLAARDRGTETDVVLGDFVLMTLTEADAAAQGAPRQVLAAQVVESFRDTLRPEADRYTTRSLLISAALALVFTLAFGLFIKFAKRGFVKLSAALEAWRQREGAVLSLRSTELLSRSTLVKLALGVFNLFKVGLYTLSAYAYAAATFGLFPWTKTWAKVMVGYVLDPAATVFWGIIHYLPNLFFIAVIGVVTSYAMRLVNYLAALVEKGTLDIPHLPPDLARPTRQIAKFLVFLLALVVVTPYLPGADSAAARNLTIFFGVLISLGSSSLVGSLLSGFVLTYMRAFRIGDRVQVADTVGDVVGRSLLAVKIRTIKNEDIFVPNQEVVNNHIINYSAVAGEHGLILHTTVTIGYDAPWRKVHAMLLEAADRTPGLLKSPSPFVLQKSLDDFYVSYELNAYTDRPNDMNALYSDLHQNIQDCFNENGVQIMSPHYRAQPEKPVLPEEYLKSQL